MDGAGDYANKVISVAQTVEMVGTTEIPPMSVRHVDRASDIGNNTGTMLVEQLGVNGTINGPISNLSAPSPQGEVRAEAARARAKESTKPRRRPT